MVSLVVLDLDDSNLDEHFHCGPIPGKIVCLRSWIVSIFMSNLQSQHVKLSDLGFPKQSQGKKGDGCVREDEGHSSSA